MSSIFIMTITIKEEPTKTQYSFLFYITQSELYNYISFKYSFVQLYLYIIQIRLFKFSLIVQKNRTQYVNYLTKTIISKKKIIYI